MMPKEWQYAELLGFALLMIFWFFSQRKKTVMQVAWLYALSSGFLLFYSPFVNPDPVTSLVVARAAAQAFASLLIIPIVIGGLSGRYFKEWRNYFSLLALADVVLFSHRGYGIFSAASFDSAFWAAMLPMAPWVALPFLVAGIVVAKGATAYLILLAQGLAYFIYRLGHRQERVKYGLRGVGLFTAIMLLIGYFTQKHPLWQDGQRLIGWRHAMEWWAGHANHWFGMGLGTFWAWAINLPPLPDGQYLLHMHNDWLQVLFELGWLGLILVVLVYFEYLWFSYKTSDRLFCMWAGIGAFAMTYHPLRFFITQALIGFLAWETYWRYYERKARGI